MKKIKSIKSVSWQQLCEAIENGDEAVISELDEFAAETPAQDEDADFTAPTDDEEPVEDDTEEGTEGGLVSVEIDPKAPLSEILRTVADAIEASQSDDEEVEDDTDEVVEDDTDEEVEDDADADEEEGVEDDTECEGDECEPVSEDEESVADSDSDMKTAKTKELARTKKTPAINRNKTVDAQLGDIVKQEGDPAGVKPLERTKKTPSINRSKVATSRLNPKKRLTDVGKGK